MAQKVQPSPEQRLGHTEFWPRQARHVREAVQRVSTGSQLRVSVKRNEGYEAKGSVLDVDPGDPADAHVEA